MLLDTNILLRLQQPDHPAHAITREAVQSRLSLGVELCICSQNLYEFWSAATRPLENNGLGMSVSEADTELERACMTFKLLADPADLPATWRRLVVEYECKGKTSHDARLVAVMKLAGISELMTFNAQDFRRFTDIQVVTPG